MSVPNQKIVQVAQRVKRSKNNLFATMNLEALQEAMVNLNGSALKMWLYFNKNQDKYRMELSRKACEEWGIKKDSYYNGLRELAQKGYLRQSRPGSNIYYFYESAQAENQKTDELVFYESDKTKGFSENQQRMYDYPKKMSNKPQRNNINNTRILQNNTSSAKPENDDDYWAELEQQEESEARKRTWASYRDLGF